MYYIYRYILYSAYFSHLITSEINLAIPLMIFGVLKTPTLPQFTVFMPFLSISTYSTLYVGRAILVNLEKVSEKWDVGKMRCRESVTKSVSLFRQKLCRKSEMSEKWDHPHGVASLLLPLASVKKPRSIYGSSD